MEASDAGEVEPVAELLCGHCRYNLRGVPSDRCPECGRQFDPNHLITSLIPWEQRKYLGRIRAFARTVWIASFHPRRLAEKMDRPISRSAARWFHALVVLIAVGAVFTIPASLLSIWPRLFENSYLGALELYAFVLNNESFYLSTTAIAVWLMVGTALTGCFARSRTMSPEQQHRALAISHYACAPLVFFAFFLLVIWGVSKLFSPQSVFEPAGAAMLLAQLIGAVVAIAALIWLLKRRTIWGKPRLSPEPPAPLHPGFGIAAIALGAIGVTLAWIKLPPYTNALAPPAANALGAVGLAAILAPLAWWWITSLRLLRLTCGFTRARTIGVAVALLFSWLAVLIVLVATAHAIYIVVTMVQAR